MKATKQKQGNELREVNLPNLVILVSRALFVLYASAIVIALLDRTSDAGWGLLFFILVYPFVILSIIDLVMYAVYMLFRRRAGEIDRRVNNTMLTLLVVTLLVVPIGVLISTI